MGKTISFSDSGASNVGGNGAWNYTVSIEKKETVKTPADSLPSFVILQIEQTHGPGGRWERRWWYAPLVGYVVKFDFKTVHGNPPPNYPKNWELVEIRKP